LLLLRLKKEIPKALIYHLIPFVYHLFTTSLASQTKVNGKGYVPFKNGKQTKWLEPYCVCCCICCCVLIPVTHCHRMWSDFPTYHQVKSPPRCTSFTSGELSYSNQAFPTQENLWRLAMWLASNGEKSNSAESTVIFYLWSCNPHSNLAFTLSIAPINLMYPHLPLCCSSLPELTLLFPVFTSGYGQGRLYGPAGSMGPHQTINRYPNPVCTGLHDPPGPSLSSHETAELEDRSRQRGGKKRSGGSEIFLEASLTLKCDLHMSARSISIAVFFLGRGKAFWWLSRKKQAKPKKRTSWQGFFGLEIKIWCHRTHTKICTRLHVSARLMVEPNVSGYWLSYGLS